MKPFLQLKKMNNIEISIIIPIYNAEKYLRECLDSALNQSIEVPYEVIGVLCPCKDKSKEISLEYAKKYENFVMLEIEDAPGPAISRFKGIEKSRGKYICFLDSDDLYHRDYLKTLYEEAEKGYDIVNCNFYSYRDGKSKKYIFSSNKTRNSVQSVRAMLWDTNLRSFLWNKMFRRELFTEHKVYYPKRARALFEDTATLCSVLLNIKSMKSIKTPLHYYRVNPTSLTNVVNKERFNFHLYTFALIRHLCDQAGEEYVKAFRKTFPRSYWSMFYDAHLLKKEFGHGPFKHLRLYKEQLKKLKSKKPLPIEGEVWESYIKECL